MVGMSAMWVIFASDRTVTRDDTLETRRVYKDSRAWYRDIERHWTNSPWKSSSHLSLSACSQVIHKITSLETITFIFHFSLAVSAQPRPTPSKNDFRNEFDHLLVATAIERFHQIEFGLSRLQREINELNETKSKVEQERIVAGIEIAVNEIAGAKAVLERELQRTDLDLLEKFNFENALAVGKVLTEDLKAIEVKVKAVQTH